MKLRGPIRCIPRWLAADEQSAPEAPPNAAAQGRRGHPADECHTQGGMPVPPSRPQSGQQLKVGSAEAWPNNALAGSPVRPLGQQPGAARPRLLLLLSPGRCQEHCWRPVMAAAGPPPPIRASPEDRGAHPGAHPLVAERIVIEASYPGLPPVPCEGVSCQAVQVGKNTPTWYWHCPATGARYLHLRSTQACQMGKVHLLAAASVDNGKLRYKKPFVFAALKSQSKVRAGARCGCRKAVRRPARPRRPACQRCAPARHSAQDASPPR